MDLGAGVLILAVGGLLILNDTSSLTVGALVAFQLYWNMLNNAYQSLQNIVTGFTRAAAAAERVFTLLDMLPDIDNKEGVPLSRDEVRGELVLKDVTFFYQMRPERIVLNKLNLRIPPVRLSFEHFLFLLSKHTHTQTHTQGSTVALVGRSGGGKTTLIHMLLRFYDPKNGTLLLDGLDVKEINIRDYRSQFGIVSQETSLFARTIRDNITYGTEGATEEDVINAAKQARAHHFIIRDFPEGYDTRVGERGLRISGGQRQRIAIARALLRKPKILLLDEATSALDAENEALVQAAIDELIKKSKSTVVLVAHRLSTVINADIIAVVDQGKIVESGPHEDLMRLNGIYANLVKRQIAKRVNNLDEDDVDVDKLVEEMEKEKKLEERKVMKKKKDKENGGSGGVEEKKEG